MRRSILAALLCATAACATGAPPPPPAFVAAADGYSVAAQRAKIVRIAMRPDTSFLTAEERDVVNDLIQAADLLDPIFLRQVSADNPRVREEIASLNRADGPLLLDWFDFNAGPWDTLADNRPFWGDRPMPAGGGLYPVDLTREALDAYIAAHPGEKEALTSPYTVVKRDGDKLVAVPYSVEYKQWLEPAAQKLEQAAAITTNPSLKKFLTLRAKAFRTDDYYESELAWMDLKDTPIEMVIGPYETYTDTLYGAKTAYEAYVVLRNPKESSALDIYKGHLREMEANLPEEEQYKNFKRGFASPISVGDQIHAGGDSNHGIQTVAFNLPNDERVREAKGAKKVILQNVLGAKYDRILQPMASLVLVPADAANVNKRYMYMETLFHELSHSLGPGSITVNGQKTTVDKALKDVGSGFEEAKADVMGAYNVEFMMDKGVLPAAEKPQIRAAYVAGLFRAMRFGDTDAHGRGAAMQYH